MTSLKNKLHGHIIGAVLMMFQMPYWAFLGIFSQSSTEMSSEGIF
jgi:hypothetical protein